MLVWSGTPLDTLVNTKNSRQCTELCLVSFNSNRRCFHGFSFCIRCNDVWSNHTHDGCPNHGGSRHQSLNQSSSFSSNNDFKLDYCFVPDKPSEFVKHELLSQSVYSSDDETCDDECCYTFDIVREFMCRHGKVKCHACASFIWDGDGQCPECNFRSPRDDFSDSIVELDTNPQGGNFCEPDSTMSD